MMSSSALQFMLGKDSTVKNYQCFYYYQDGQSQLTPENLESFFKDNFPILLSSYQANMAKANFERFINSLHLREDYLSIFIKAANSSRLADGDKLVSAEHQDGLTLNFY